MFPEGSFDSQRKTIRTDGADLVVSNPNAGVRRRGRVDPEPAAGGDDGLLQLAHVPSDALREQITYQHTLPTFTLHKRKTAPDLLETAQVEDRVADQLARPVEGDESAPVGVLHVGPEQAQALQLRRRVRFVADPGGVDRRMLTQQESVSRTGPVPVHVDLLQPQSLRVGDPAQTDHLHQRLVPRHPGLERYGTTCQSKQEDL